MRWVVLALVGVCGVNQAISSMRGALPDGGPGPRAVPFPTYSAAPPPAPLPPSPNVTVPAAPPAAPATVADLIGTQILAVRLDNEAMFLGTVDPGAKAARETYKRIFANLHALLAIDFTETLGQSGDPAVGGRVSSPVSMAFCAGGTTTECALTTAHLDVQVGPTAKGVAIEAVTPAVTGSMRAAPWVVTPLTATITGNVLVAGTPTSKAQIAQVTPAAGIAGDRAEAYTLGYVDFRRYVVYLASHADMLAWFGDLDRISYGALDPPVGYDQVVLALPDAMRTGPGGGDGLAADLQRALAKASLTGNDDRPVPVDTLSTGLWAYAAYDGLDGSAPSVDADTLAPVRGFTTGDWAYTCDYSAGNVPLDGITAMPGVGLLAIRFLVDQYGFAAVLRFWDKVERAGEQIENASIEEFNGIPWPEVDSDCASQVAALAGP